MFSFEEKVNSLVNFVKAGKAALFVGSGASVDAHLPGWDTLEDTLRRKLAAKHVNTTELNVLQLADHAKQTLGAEYYEILRKAFRNPLAEPGELDELLSSLRPYFKFVVTPNYDKLLETAFRTIRLGIDPPITTKLEMAQAFARREEFFVYKFNGDIDDEQSIILGGNDYANQDYEVIFDFLRAFKILYIGYGLRDPILEHFRRKAGRKNVGWKTDVLVMMKTGTLANNLLGSGYRVVTFSNFEEQKHILQEVCASLVENPFRTVYQRVCIPSTDIATNALFVSVRDSVRAVAGRMLILHENWEFGWDADDFEFEIGRDHELPKQAQRIVDECGHEIGRPWWGKFAYMGIVYPLTERRGKIIGAGTSYRKYSVLWRKMDDTSLLTDTTIRERWWQYDIKEQFVNSELPHVLCMHMAVVSKDGKLLLTRKSEDIDFERRAWCPSMEEQESNGIGEETVGDKPIDKSPKATCLRGLEEELRIPKKWISSIRFHAFCTDWIYSDVAVIGTVLLNIDSNQVSATFGGEDVGEFQLDPKRWIQYCWTPARVDNVARLLKSSEYGEGRLRGVWHVSAKLRLFSLIASMVQWGWATWTEWESAALVDSDVA